MSGDFELGLAVGVFTAFIVVALSPRPNGQAEWDLRRQIETQKKEIDDVSLAYINALRRAAVCVDEDRKP